MYWKVAFRNVRKSYHDFFVYFVTLLFSVCLFYTFNSFHAQKEMMILSQSQDMMLQMTHIFMVVLSVFVILILAALILYANRFLIKRRKKEFGLYMLLGMSEKAISRILIYEVLMIGLLSLILGLFMGFGLSQLFAIITARVIQVTVDFHVVFSYEAALFTLLCFSGIFLLTMWSNVRTIRRQKLIELLQAQSKQEKQRLHSFYLSILLFVCSLLLLGITYYLATSSLASFGQFFIVILGLGSLGTLLFFFSLTGFLLRFISKSSNIYYRSLNMFVLRQIHSRINSNYISMAIVCLMLLLSIGALATGWNMNLSVSDRYRIAAPYDMSYIQYLPSEQNDIVLDRQDIARETILPIYESDMTSRSLYANLEADEYLKQVMNYDVPLVAIPYSQYVSFCEAKGLDIVSMKENEMILFASQREIVDQINEHKKADMVLTLFDEELQVTDEVLYLQFYTDIRMLDSVMLILPDSLLMNAQQIREVHNFDVMPDVDVNAFQKDLEAQLHTEAQWVTYTRAEVYENTVSLGLLFTYIGLYLGIVFLLASAAILALQQLSEADDNRHRYEILSKIGTEKAMMNHAITLQIGIYFLLPLLLAIVHSYYGIKAVATAFAFIVGSTSMVSASLLSACCIIAIYGIYFIITVKSYQRILYQKS